MAGPSRQQSPVKRLLTELNTYQSDPNEALEHLGPVNEDELMHWTAVMRGVPGTAYEGRFPVHATSWIMKMKVLICIKDGRWELSIAVPNNYPLSPPTITFTTPICHPNVHFQTGEICLDLLKAAWSPAYTISSTLTVVHQLLTSAEPDSPLNIDVALLMRTGDVLGAESLIKYYTVTKRYEGGSGKAQVRDV